MRTTIINIKDGLPYDIYIGRPSKWGNPFSHKEETIAEYKVRSRKEALEKYREYLLNNEELMNSLDVSEKEGTT